MKLAIVFMAVALQLINAQVTPGVATFSCLGFIDNENEHEIELVYTPDNMTSFDGFVRLFVENNEMTDTANTPDTQCFDNDNTADGLQLRLRAGTTAIDCGLVNDGSNVVTVNAILAQNQMVVQSTDIRYTFTCSFNDTQLQNVTATNGTAGAELVGVGGLPITATPQAVIESVSMNVVLNGAEDTPIASCNLGDQIKMSIVLTLSTTARGVRAIFCDARSLPSDPRQLTLLKDRCPFDNPGFEDIATGVGFMRDATNADANTYRINSGEFKCFKFDNADTLSLRCVVAFCRQDGDDTCDMNQCANGPLNPDPAGISRRRRDVFDGVDVQSENVEVLIRVGENGVSNPIAGVRPTPAAVPEKFSCWHATEFVVIVAILAALLLISIVLSIFMCIRARSMHDNRHCKSGFDNPNL